MRSKRPLLLPFLPLLLAALCLALASPASAQIYKWKDANGRTVISDKPPPGQLPVPQQNDSDAPGDPAPAAQSAQPSLADRELEFRKRQKETRESAEKAERETAAAAEKEENCQNARRRLQMLESGGRIALRDDKGGRYFMDDAQRAQETAKTRQHIDTQCQ
jgi:hypothetical protein